MDRCRQVKPLSSLTSFSRWPFYSTSVAGRILNRFPTALSSVSPRLPMNSVQRARSRTRRRISQSRLVTVSEGDRLVFQRERGGNECPKIIRLVEVDESINIASCSEARRSISTGKLSLFSCRLDESCSKQRETLHLSVRRKYTRSYGASDYSVDLREWWIQQEKKHRKNSSKYHRKSKGQTYKFPSQITCWSEISSNWSSYPLSQFIQPDASGKQKLASLSISACRCCPLSIPLTNDKISALSSSMSDAFAVIRLFCVVSYCSSFGLYWAKMREARDAPLC